MRIIPRWSGYAFLLALPLLCHCQVTQQLFRASLTSGSGADYTQIVVSGAIPFIPDSRNPGSAYVDAELLKILSVQTTGTFGNVQANTVLTVQRGQGGTAATQHNSGALIYAGYAYQFITTTPSGACSPGSANLLNYNTAAWFSCEASVWVSRPTSTGGGGGTGTVTSITASAPLTGGTITASGSIGCQVASGSQAGCLSAADYSAFTGKQPAGSYLVAPGSSNIVVKYTTGTATAPALFADFAVLLSGTPSSSTFARGDGAWAVPPGSGAVSSVFGRTGAIVAASADYTAAQVTNAASTAAANTFGAFLQSFAASSVIIPKSAAASPTVAGQIAYDTVSNTYQFGNGTGSDAVAYFLGSPPTIGNCIMAGTAAYQLANIPCPGGGNVSNTGTPTSGQYAKWTNATTIQGVTGVPGGDITGSNSIPAAALPIATTSAFGAIKPDGTTITCPAGVCSSSGGSSPLTTKGDLFGFSTVNARIPVGTNGQILTADSTQTLGVKWATGTPGSTATAITSGVLGSLPGTCAAGDVYFATNQPAGEQLYQCDSTNHFTETFLHDTTLVNTAGSFGVNLSQFCQFTNSCNIGALWGFAIGQDFTEQASGSTPAASKLHIYANTDHTFHQVTSGGVDTSLSGGGVTTHYGLITNTATTQTIPGTSTATPITFDTNEDLTNSALHSTSSNQQNFVADATGRWSGACQVTATNDAINFKVIVFINGVAEFNNGGDHTAGAQNQPWSWHLTSGDIVTCQASSAAGFTVASAGTTFYGFLVH